MIIIHLQIQILKVLIKHFTLYVFRNTLLKHNGENMDFLFKKNAFSLERKKSLSMSV